LATAAEIREVKREGGLNIEALEMSADQRRLLIGLRSPLLGGRAIVASLENPRAIFDEGAKPQIASTLTTLDLAGNGIRGMAYAPCLAGYLLIGGPVARQEVDFSLWFWSGAPQDRPRRVHVAGLPGLEHAEGVTQALFDGQARIVVVSDDGNRAAGHYARYLVLRPQELLIGP